MLKQWRFGLVLMMVLSLAACASSDKDDVDMSNQGVPVVNEDGVTVHPLGDEDGYYGKDKKYSLQQLMDQNVIYFDFDSNVIKANQMPIVEAHAHYLALHPNAHVLLEGNTDARGSREYNVALGYRRDQAVQQVFIANGVKSSQIETVSYGAEKPAVLGETEDAYSKNRRVEIVYENKS